MNWRNCAARILSATRPPVSALRPSTVVASATRAIVIVVSATRAMAIVVSALRPTAVIASAATAVVTRIAAVIATIVASLTLSAGLRRTLWRLLVGWMRLRSVLRRFGGELFAGWRVGLVGDRWCLCRIAAVIAATATATTLAARAFRIGAAKRGRPARAAAGDGRIYACADCIIGALIAIIRSIVGTVFVVRRRAHSARSCCASCAMSASIASCAFAL